MKFVLDASAAIAYLRAEPGGEKVKALFKPEFQLLIHAVNLLEVYYKLASYADEVNAQETIDDLSSLGVKIYETLDISLRKRAGFFKIRYPFLSLADSICIALADQTGSTVVTSDQPFRKVGDSIEMLMIRDISKRDREIT